MLVLNIVIALLFIILGIALANGKGVNLIAGYNTLSKQDKEKIDADALCKYTSAMMFGLAVCWCVLSAGLQAELMWLFWIGLGLFIAVTVFFVIFLNTGDRLKK